MRNSSVPIILPPGVQKEENIINAPIDVVWEKTLQILPTGRITLKEVDKDIDSGDKICNFSQEIGRSR